MTVLIDGKLEDPLIKDKKVSLLGRVICGQKISMGRIIYGNCSYSLKRKEWRRTRTSPRRLEASGFTLATRSQGLAFRRLEASPKTDMLSREGRRKGLPKKGNPLTQKSRQGLAPRRLEASPKTDMLSRKGRRKGLPKKGNCLTQKGRQGLAPRRLEASPKKKSTTLKKKGERLEDALELIPAPGDNVI
ncbi:hypothetical protein BY996DRAFT_6598392 [Phakopsora pachyrhizi]|uniref:Uncharacterized protein n=1 Tax=Phakopsora pachyrhizi TaxID=170000 RepID=A0AAV0B422_PHAPC|nr:hypothetical protein BY996DRAFT_6598392 [Phakopsora pachyrhizi]CAH7677164.1 hypothetical protein PPACK8108_LOCUS12304 [Phakopsora pachyrhizi]